MSDRPFSYAVYRLVPRVERGERVNVGVVVFCRPLDYLVTSSVQRVIRERRLYASSR